ncbi:hypothetical protein P175DRAFT_0532948 [Aspergillus ochraceoroseus IBT 24754]|uniref:Uncharacterized protein n=1 Tax=Aspergillus ochraceoroseus IBT 24754 TaxID=1392256 RepID=A0A2T5LUQ2_9EURO|nr:uncharacterized protein P175DRAFT_0532948 [Aspergillus ochraceoroseus IBT 24754]PTU19983.1 hypothetical protein P175DRAFT_0532948 [Aspergillus ochraceoroseus IBT 24754]
METETGCQCSVGALKIMNELRNVHTVVEVETILGLVERIHALGHTMLKCKECRASPGSSLMTLPALAEQCLSLFEALCLAYNITRKNSFFEPPILAFEQSLHQFLCIRSKMQLGQMELDDDETTVLVRVLLGKNLMKLLELLKALRSLYKECGQSHRAGVSGLRACEAPVESIIHRLAVFMEQIDVESGMEDAEGD